MTSLSNCLYEADFYVSTKRIECLINQLYCNPAVSSMPSSKQPPSLSPPDETIISKIERNLHEANRLLKCMSMEAFGGDESNHLRLKSCKSQINQLKMQFSEMKRGSAMFKQPTTDVDDMCLIDHSEHHQKERQRHVHTNPFTSSNNTNTNNTNNFSRDYSSYNQMNITTTTSESSKIKFKCIILIFVICSLWLLYPMLLSI